MTPSCGWIAARGQYPKITVVQKFDRRKNPQDVQGVALYLVLSLDYDFDGIWWLSRSGFNFPESQCLPLAPSDFVYPVLAPEAFQEQIISVRREVAM